MFIKPLKLKSNVQLKGSERKKLRTKVEKNFPQVKESDFNNLIPNKATVTLIKVITYREASCNIYAADKRPIFFEDESGILIPTVYTLWVIPDLLPFFTTHDPVLPKLGNGADLMLPGVIRQGAGLKAYGNYKKDQIVAVNLVSNSAAVGIGKLARSSDDLYMSAGNGTCVNMLHVFGDKLWGFEMTATLPIPQLGPVIQIPKNDDFPELGSTRVQKQYKMEDQIPELIQKTSKSTDNIVDEHLIETLDNVDIQNSLIESPSESNIETASSCNTNMDEVLRTAFLTALKRDGKKLTLPILTSNFYRLHVLPNARTQIDLKQTSYKKLSKFLNEMSNFGLIVVREETKGIEKIIAIDFENPELIDFIPDTRNTDNNGQEAEVPLFHTTMMEVYIVTDETLRFFAKLGFGRDDRIEGIQIKKMLKEYISQNRLPTNSQNRTINLDLALSEICNRQDSTFDDLLSVLLSKMSHTYEMRSKNESRSGNKPIIQMTTATRSGNKKVTLVSNLEAYGIILPEFAKSCKVGAAASTSIIKAANQKQEIVQIQGNQIRFIYNLLTEKYKIPPKQISGLDLAKKEKKKK